jgi:hypothetical protein
MEGSRRRAFNKLKPKAYRATTEPAAAGTRVFPKEHQFNINSS